MGWCEEMVRAQRCAANGKQRAWPLSTPDSWPVMLMMWPFTSLLLPSSSLSPSPLFLLILYHNLSLYFWAPTVMPSPTVFSPESLPIHQNSDWRNPSPLYSLIAMGTWLNGEMFLAQSKWDWEWMKAKCRESDWFQGLIERLGLGLWGWMWNLYLNKKTLACPKGLEQSPRLRKPAFNVPPATSLIFPSLSLE